MNAMDDSDYVSDAYMDNISNQTDDEAAIERDGLAEFIRQEKTNNTENEIITMQMVIENEKSGNELHTFDCTDPSNSTSISSSSGSSSSGSSSSSSGSGSSSSSVSSSSSSSNSTATCNDEENENENEKENEDKDKDCDESSCPSVLNNVNNVNNVNNLNIGNNNDNKMKSMCMCVCICVSFFTQRLRNNFNLCFFLFCFVFCYRTHQQIKLKQKFINVKNMVIKVVKVLNFHHQLEMIMRMRMRIVMNKIVIHLIQIKMMNDNY